MKNGKNPNSLLQYCCLDKLYRMVAYLLCLCPLFVLTGCDKEEEPLPAYLYIPSAALSANYIDFGSERAEITDVWLYVNDQIIGVFDLPALVPIVQTGEVTISMEAGVLENDFQSVRQNYPFFTFYHEDITLTSLVTDTIVPIFNYKESTSVVFRNDFENGNTMELREGLGANFTIISNNQTFEGARSGRVTLSGENSFYLIGAIDEFFLPQPISSNKLSYLELDYKNTSGFNLFLGGSEIINGQLTTFAELVLLFPTQPTWNKIYVNLSNTIRLHPEAQSYNVVFQAILPDSLNTAEYYFDNVKIMHE